MPPDSLCREYCSLKVLYFSYIMGWIAHEPLAITKYTEYQPNHGHDSLVFAPADSWSARHTLSLVHRHMAQCVTHPTEVILLDLLEIKCPFSHHNMTPKEACLDRQLCCTMQENADRTKQVVLKRDHLYFAQVQGQMAVGERPWYDFVIYTTQGLRLIIRKKVC